MSPNAVRAWSWVHKWTSLVCTVFLLMLCVTGLPLVFSHEIDDILGHDRWRPEVEGNRRTQQEQADTVGDGEPMRCIESETGSAGEKPCDRSGDDDCPPRRRLLRAGEQAQRQ